MKKLALLSCLLLAGAFGCGGGDDSALRMEKEKLEANVRNLEQEKIQKQEENDRLQAEREALRGEATRLQDESNRKSMVFDDEKKSWAEARQSFVDENEGLQKQINEKEALLEQQRNLAAASASLKDEIDRLNGLLKQEEQTRQRDNFQFEQTKAALEASLNKLKKELQDLDDSNKQLEKEVSQLRDDLLLAQDGSSDAARLSKEIIGLRSRNKKFEEENTQLGASISDLNNRLTALQSGSDQQTQTIVDKTAQIDRLNSDKQSLETDNAELRKQLEDEQAKLQNSVNGLLASNLELSNKVRDVQKALEDEIQKNSDASLSIAGLREQLRDLEEKCVAQFNSQQSILDAKATDIKDLTATVNSLKAERQTLLDQKVSLENLLDDSRKLAVRLAGENSQHQANFEQLTLAKQSLETDNAELRKQLEREKEQMESEVTALSQGNAKLENDILQLRDLLASQKQQSDLENSRLVQFNQGLSGDLAQLRELEKKNKADNERLDALNKNIDEELKKLKVLRESETKENELYKKTSIAQINELSESIRGLEAEKQTLLAEKVTLEASIDKLKAEARRQEIERKNQIAEYAKLAEAKESLDVDYEALQRQLETERNALRNKGSELISAKKELNKRIADLETLLNDERLKVSQKDESLTEMESKLAEEKRKGQDAIRAAEENERLRVRSEGSADSVVELHKEIQDLKNANHNLKLDNEKVKSTVEKLESDLLARNDPHEIFKRASQEFLVGLKTAYFSDQYSKNQIATFKEDIRYLASSERLLDEPEQDPKRLSVPLALIFEQAPKPTEEFTVYIASAADDWDALEKTAQFILATDDLKMLEEFLVRKGKGELDYREFKVQVDFPILCLGPKIFMLPKELLNPLFENEMSKVIELNYGFDEGLNEPLEYQTYIEKKKIRDERVATSKNQAVRPESR